MMISMVFFSPVDGTLGVISGRPFGGVPRWESVRESVIMWRKSVDIVITVINLQLKSSHLFETVHYDNNWNVIDVIAWLCGVKIKQQWQNI